MITSKKWYAVYTRPKWERKVAQLLTSRKIEAYCPLNKVYKQWSDRKSSWMSRCLPYVFVHVNPGEHSLVKQADGVINFVYWLGSPAIIRDEEIVAIREFLEEHHNVKLEKDVSQRQRQDSHY